MCGRALRRTCVLGWHARGVCPGVARSCRLRARPAPWCKPFKRGNFTGLLPRCTCVRIAGEPGKDLLPMPLQMAVQLLQEGLLFALRGHIYTEGPNTLLHCTSYVTSTGPSRGIIILTSICPCYQVAWVPDDENDTQHKHDCTDRTESYKPPCNIHPLPACARTVAK